VIFYPRLRLVMVKRAAAAPAPGVETGIVWDLFVAAGSESGGLVGMFLTDHATRKDVLKQARVDANDARPPDEKEIHHHTNIILAYPQGRMRLTEDDFRLGIAPEGFLPPLPKPKKPDVFDENSPILTIGGKRRRGR
jgi:hypothetical protein